jgi:nucleotide-binding universal stress UspA family protein
MLRSILVPLDGSPLAERALPIACDLVRRGKGALHLVRAHVPLAIAGATAEGVLTQDMLDADDALRERALKTLCTKAKALADEWGIPVDARVEDGSPAAVISDAADAVKAGLIVMTTHGAGGFAPGWLGSIADGVIRHSHRPVLVLPSNDAHKGVPFVPRRIMVALDGSERADAIIPPARDLALLFGAQLDFVRIVSPYIPGDVGDALTASRPDPMGLDEQADAAKQSLDIVVKGMEEQGLIAHATVRMDPWPVKSILAHVQESDPDCVALSTQGRGFSRLFVGSVADKLIRSGARPALVLRPLKD